MAAVVQVQGLGACQVSDMCAGEWKFFGVSVDDDGCKYPVGQQISWM